MTVKKELRWKRLIDTDVLCDSYSQRVFASFGLLDSYNKGYFTLDDFVKRGLIVEEFLSLNVNTGTSFHVMNSFREFDVDGNGIVPIEEFVEKVIEKLGKFSDDGRAMEESATSLLPPGNKTINEMVFLLKPEKQMNAENKIAAFVHIIEAYLGKAASKNWESSLENSLMRARDLSGQDIGSLILEIIRAAMKISILELSRRFHFKRKLCTYMDDHSFASVYYSGSNEETEIKTYEVRKNPSIYMSKFYRCGEQNDMQSFEGELLNALDDFFNMLSKPRCRWRRLRKINFPSIGIVVSPFFTNLKVLLKNDVPRPSNAPQKTFCDEFDISQLYILHHGLYVIKKVWRDFNVIVDSSRLIPTISQSLIPKTPLKLQDSEADDEYKSLSNHLSRQLSVAQFKLLQSEVRLKMFSALQVDIIDISNHENKEHSHRSSDGNDARIYNPIRTVISDGNVPGNVGICEEVNEEEKRYIENIGSCKGLTSRNYGEICTINDIMQEIFKLKGCAAFRGKEDSYLGQSLSSCTGMLHFSNGGMEDTGESFAQSIGSPRLTKASNFGDLLTSYIMYIVSFVRSPRDPSGLWGLISHALPQLSMSSIAVSHTNSNLSHSSHDAHIESTPLDEDVSLHSIRQYDDSISFLVEQSGDSSETVMNMAVELQLLREKIKRLNLTNISNKVIHKSSAATGGDKYLEVDSATMVDEVEEHGHEYTEHSFADELPHRNSKEEIKNLWQKSRKFISKIARLELENRRLSTNLGQMGANLSKALQDNLALRQKVTRLEDNNAAVVMFQGHLQDDILRERSLREDRELLYSRVQELERNLSLTQNNLLELQEENRQLQKAKDELEVAENRVSEMTNEISLLSMDNERADLAMQQVEEYRCQLREYAKVDRERSIYVHKLELEAREAKLLRARSNDLFDEVQIYKSKVEKFPTFLAESARLRACNKAVFKSLSEHDKSSVSSAARMKELEREILRLKNENRMYQHTEKQLKDVNLDYKHLSQVIGQLNFKEKKVHEFS